MRTAEAQTVLAGSKSQRTDTREIVLVGFAEALAAPEVVWSLVDGGFEVLAFARRGRPCAIRHSRFVKCFEICPPESDLQASLRDLIALLEEIARQDADRRCVVFPLDDKAVWLCGRLPLAASRILAGPQNGAVELALNKDLQCQAAREAGFAVPQGRLCTSPEEVSAFVQENGFPVILKAAEAVPIVGGKVFGCPKWICADQREIERAIRQWSKSVPILIQQFIPGTGEGIFGIATAGGIRAWSGHRRLRMMNPQGSGASACVSQVVSKDLQTKTEQLIESTGWRGLFMVELLRDDAGKVWFVELNGRPWGSIALARKQGLEYPSWQVKLAIDPHSDSGREVNAVSDVVCRNLGREFMHLLFVIKGSKSTALVSWPSVWATLRRVLALHSGDRVYNWRRDDPKVFVADFYYTVHQNIFKGGH